MASKILEEALQEAKILKETAFETARNVLVEAISPTIKEFMDDHMNSDDGSVDSGVMSMPEPQDSQDSLDHLDPQMLAKLLKLLQKTLGAESGSEVVAPMDQGSHDEHGENGEEEMPEGMYEEKEEDDKDVEEKDDENDDKNMEEQIVKITEEDLAKAWSEVVREEALQEAQVPSPQVSGEFADVQNPNSNAKGGLGDSGAPGDRGLEDKEKEQMWKDEVPPASQDWTVKEGVYKKQLATLSKENSQLKRENSELKLSYDKVHRMVKEVNLFNKKLLHTNQLLQAGSLTAEQRNTVIEAIDQAESIREVELVYNTLSETFKMTGVLSENKQQAKQRQRGSRFTTSATANLLKEQAHKDEGGSNNVDPFAARMKELSGLVE